jgi:hypothetical protein
VRYQTRFRTIEAYQWFKSMGSGRGVRQVVAHSIDMTKKDASGKEIGRGIIHEAPERYVCDSHLGSLVVSEGDYIVTGAHGYYIVDPTTFEAQYEPFKEGEQNG